MEQPVTIGIDLAKSVFEVHGVDAVGEIVLRRTLRRSQVLEFCARLEPCLIGMEACAGAHFRARELGKLGHEVRLMPPSCVKPYVKRGKSDRADAEAICEAVTRPGMRFVPVKSEERQAAMPGHKTRDFLIRQQTAIVNAIRAHLAEFGPVVAKGIHNVGRLLDAVAELPEAARPAIALLADQLRQTQARLAEVTRRIEAAQKLDPLARRLATIPGIAMITSSALAAATPEVGNFRCARDHAAWPGLTPRSDSTGGKVRVGHVSRAGNACLRRLLHLGAMARISARRRGKPGDDRLWQMLQTKKPKVVAIALANRMARIVWALIRSGDRYRSVMS